MKKLCITLLFYLHITKVIGQSVIINRSTIDNSTYIDLHDDRQVFECDSGCECIKYDCGCCQFIRWDPVYLNGTLCANASYLEFDYGISITVTYNDIAIINETVSARNPPPICVGEDIVDGVEIEVCLYIFDIDITHDEFHACFKIQGRFMRLKLVTIKLGCVNTKYENLKYTIEDNAIPRWSQLSREKQEKSSSSGIFPISSMIVILLGCLFLFLSYTDAQFSCQHLDDFSGSRGST